MHTSRYVLVFLTLIFSLSQKAFSQNRWGTEYSFQMQSTRLGDYQIPANIADGNYTYVAMDNGSNFKSELGFTLRYYLTYKLGLSAGVFYSGQGQKYKDYDENSSGGFYFSEYSWERKLKLNYLKIPLSIQYESQPFEAVSVFGNLGVYLSFLTGFEDSDKAFIFNMDTYANYESTSNKDGIYASYEETWESESLHGEFTSKPYRSRDWGINGAIGLNFRLSERLFLPISIQYQYGLADIKNSNAAYRVNGSQENYLYWGNSSNPNSSIAYHTRAVGLKFALNYRF